MLHLASETDPSWAQRAVGDLDTLLLDHAHLEKKAASTAMTLSFRYPDVVEIQRPLSELAREELEHFEAVLSFLEARGQPFTRLQPAPYAAKLSKAIRKAEPERMLDTFLTCALIEARSCERMRLIAEALPAGALAEFYEGLLATEARHHMLYVEFARGRFGAAVADARLAELADQEAAILAEAPRLVRMHNG